MCCCSRSAPASERTRLKHPVGTTIAHLRHSCVQCGCAASARGSDPAERQCAPDAYAADEGRARLGRGGAPRRRCGGPAAATSRSLPQHRQRRSRPSAGSGWCAGRPAPQRTGMAACGAAQWRSAGYLPAAAAAAAASQTSDGRRCRRAALASAAARIAASGGTARCRRGGGGSAQKIAAEPSVR